MTTLLNGGTGSRRLQDAVSYAIGHRIRVEILAALHDMETASAIELAQVVHQPLSTVTHHVNELLKAGSIQVDRVERVRSVDQRFYRSLDPHFVSDEEWEVLAYEERQAMIGTNLQESIAESLSSFWSGELASDPRPFLSWSWFNVDAQGRSEIVEEQIRAWKRIRAIEREALARCAESGEEPVSVLVSSYSCRRFRTAERIPGAIDKP
jgi:DNA-binding transcriptional ArsR family regulator